MVLNLPQAYALDFRKFLLPCHKTLSEIPGEGFICHIEDDLRQIPGEGAVIPANVITFLRRGLHE